MLGFKIQDGRYKYTVHDGKHETEWYEDCLAHYDPSCPEKMRGGEASRTLAELDAEIAEFKARLDSQSKMIRLIEENQMLRKRLGDVPVGVVVDVNGDTATIRTGRAVAFVNERPSTQKESCANLKCTTMGGLRLEGCGSPPHLWPITLLGWHIERQRAYRTGGRLFFTGRCEAEGTCIDCSQFVKVQCREDGIRYDESGLITVMAPFADSDGIIELECGCRIRRGESRPCS